MIGVKSRRSDDGSVTAETAVVLPALLVLMSLLMGAVAMVGRQAQCRDAASAVARAVARGESAADVGALVRRVAPRGAEVEVRQRDGYVVVRVESRTALRTARLLPSVAAESTAREEP